MSRSQDFQGLISRMYHEKQQSGSALCAQHALNNLLQANYFTAPDLSALARELDFLEESYDVGNTGRTSTNMDDTGFFNVQVLVNALEVWGLKVTKLKGIRPSLTPWRSETMRPYHGHPEKILAFILNLEQHWFTLRRFGDANPVIDLDEGRGHWFNLNSILKSPEWISRIHLGMLIQQLEAEGYSVFAVTQADPSQPLALFRTPVDELCSSFEEPTSSSGRGIETSLAPSQEFSTHHDFDDQDHEFQRALRASLMESRSRSSSTSTVTSATYSDLGEFSSSTSANEPLIPSLVPSSNTAPELDPVAASMERNRLLLQRMRQEQEEAQREIWSPEVDLSPEEQAAREERRTQRRQEEEEEAIQLQRAIEESQMLAKQQTGSRPLPAGAVVGWGSASDDELQTALKASLEHQRRQTNLSPSPAPSYSTDRETDEGVATVEDTAQPGPSVEEIRRARLARFA